MGHVTVDKAKLGLLLGSLREAAILVIAAVEDYLEQPYEKSALAKRRIKQGEYSVLRKRQEEEA